MTRPLFTGSSAERALACPASEALPRVEEESGPPALRGSAGHAFLATAPRIGREAALAATPPEWQPLCAAIDLETLPQTDPAGYAAEVAFSFNITTGEARELGRNLSREQAVALYAQLGRDELPCTVDAVGLTADGEGVSVIDWKFGFLRVTPAERNAQLLLGAICAARAYGRDRASVAIVYMHEDRDPFFDSAELETWDLDGGAARLRAGAAAVAWARELVISGREPDVFEGAHCRYCKAYKACRAKTALVSAITSAPQSYREDARAMLTPERAAEARRRLKLAKSALHMVDVELEAYASEIGGVDMGDGIVYGPRRSKTEKVKGPVVHQVLTELHGRDIADRAVAFTSTKSAIEDALRKVVQDTPGAKITKLNTAALDAIRAAGGVDEKVTTVVDEHRPRKPAKGEAA